MNLIKTAALASIVFVLVHDTAEAAQQRELRGQGITTTSAYPMAPAAASREQRRMETRLQADQEALAKMPAVGEVDPMSAQISWMTGGAVDEKTVRRIMSVLMALTVEIGAGFGAMIAIRAVGAVLNEKEPQAIEVAPAVRNVETPAKAAPVIEGHVIAPAIAAPRKDRPSAKSKAAAPRRQIADGTPRVNEIRELRNVLGLTQEALAEELDASPQTVQSWEQDRRVPEEPFISRINDMRTEAGLLAVEA